MADFATWKAGFEKGKKLVAVFEQSNVFAVHSLRRYVDENQMLWEVAMTYTGRLVVRAGTVVSDGVNVSWTEWKTLHDVDVPSSSPW